MSELQFNNKSNLSNIPGGFAVIPNALLGFLSNRACMVFLKIYQCQFILYNTEHNGALWVELSTPYLAKALNQHKKTIGLALDELIGLGVILCNHRHRKSVLYRINWEEIIFVCDILCNVNEDGRIKLMEMCVGTDFTPMSRLSLDSIEPIKQAYPSKQCSDKKYPNPNNVGVKNAPTSSCSDTFCTQPNNVRTLFVPNIESSGKKCPNMEDSTESHDETTDNSNVLPQCSDTFCTEHQQCSGKKYPNIDNVRAFFDHRYIYKEINKENMRERSSQYKEENNKNLLEYFSSRSFSFPGFDRTLYESFINQDLNEDDDDVIKSIKQVWGQLGYDEELPENNYIDLGTFQKILFHSWQQLKQDFPDYSLSEHDMKNIFGFLIVEHEGESCLYIDPSKLQDISASTVQEEQGPSAKERKYSDRISRSMFVDCINEIADKNDELLTSSEFVALLLMDYVESSSTGNRPVEITKMAYKSLLAQLSDQSGVSVEDIQMLFKELPQKGKVKLSPQQLSPDKFFQYNADHQQESEVEKLFKIKLAEQN